MLRVLKDLFFALLNATLILIALCLFLAWQLSNRVHDLTAAFASNLQIVEPLQQEMQDTRTELAGLRADLATLRDQSGEVSSAALQRVETRVDALESRVDGVLTQAESVVSDPSDLIDHAIQSGANELVESLGRMRGCVPADAVSAWMPVAGSA